MLNVLASVGTSLIATPIILSSLGLVALGVWTIAQSIVLYVVTTDAGIGPAVVRFTAVYQGARRQDDVRRLLWSALATYLLLGAVLVVAIELLAGELVDVFGVPEALRGDALTLFRLTAVVVVLALLSVTLANLLQGLERFGAVAVTAACASGTFLVALIVLLAAGRGLVGVGIAAMLQQAVGLATRAFVLRRLLLTRPGFVTRADAREIGAFAARLQLNVASALIVTQSDRIVVGVLATPAATGQVGIGAQIADGGRALCGAALGPFTSRMSATFGAGDVEAVRRLHRRLGERWIQLVVGGTVIAVLAMPALIRAWLGSAPGDTATYARLLVGAAGLLLATGVTTSFLRAIGRPGFEVGYGIITIVVNVVGSVGLGLLVGPLGVVAATPASYALGAAWLLWRAEPVAVGMREMTWSAVRRGLPSALVLGLVTWLACGFFAGALPRGVALVPSGLVMGAAMVAHLSWVLRVLPKPSALVRALRAQ